MTYVYAVSDGVFVKIGKSTHPGRRLDDLQTSNPRRLQLLVVAPNTTALIGNHEKAIHLRQQANRVRGEWFSEAVHDFIVRVVATDIPHDLLMQSLAFDTCLNDAAYFVLRQERVDRQDRLGRHYRR